MSRRRILLVEDDFGNRRVIRRLLEAFGYIVVEAEHGNQAIELLENAVDPFDTVLSDINMPGLDGIEMIRKIRSQDRFSQLKLIAMTAHTHLSILTQIRDAGFNDVCPKPIEVNRLVIAIEKSNQPMDLNEISHILTPDVLSELTES